jgi:hypothetical protein
MPTLSFPLQLPHVVHQNTWARPTIEHASPTECLAKARYTPKDITYETTVRLRDGKWSVKTTGGSGWQVSIENYPAARAGEIALAVINWWHATFYSATTLPLAKEIASARATWLSRTSHKLLTEVPEHTEQLAALQMLASSYAIPFVPVGAIPTLKSATWATAANHHLERALSEDHRRGAVILLLEMILDWKEGTPDHSATAAA